MYVSVGPMTAFIHNMAMLEGYEFNPEKLAFVNGEGSEIGVHSHLRFKVIRVSVESATMVNCFSYYL